MKIFNVLLTSCLLCGVVGPVFIGPAYSESITAEELIKRDAKNHTEDFACSCIDPRCP